MKKLIINLKSNLHKFLERDNIKKIDSRKMSVHYRRDLDSLGEYIKI